ncbi:MAG: PP2C family serine/threonine-protein phosphatase [Patescibacteria group bacterium]|nr:PP2C family serine/threonine-protein phosphatase [Patescibacteria group bacterium]
MFKSERPTSPQWGRGLERKENIEGEPVWQEIVGGQIEGRGEEHVKYNMGLQDEFDIREGFMGRRDTLWVGVYDGHYYSPEYETGAIFPQRIAKTWIAGIFEKELNQGKSYEEAFRIAFEVASDEICAVGTGGTTASVVLLEGNEGWVANVGDSHVYKFSASGQPEQLNVNHNVGNNIAARQEAVGRGGVYANGYIHKPGGTGLKLSRVLGDSSLGDVVSHEPAVFKFEITDDDKFFVIASDGLWDDVVLKKVQSILDTSANAQEAQKKLMEATIKDGINYDDATVIVVALKK